MFIGEADEPDPREIEREQQPRRPQHGDRVKRRIKLGEDVPYDWIVLRIIALNAARDAVICEVQLDFKGTRSLK